MKTKKYCIRKNRIFWNVNSENWNQTENIFFGIEIYELYAFMKPFKPASCCIQIFWHNVNLLTSSEGLKFCFQLSIFLWVGCFWNIPFLLTPSMWVHNHCYFQLGQLGFYNFLVSLFQWNSEKLIKSFRIILVQHIFTNSSIWIKLLILFMAQTTVKLAIA